MGRHFMSFVNREDICKDGFSTAIRIGFDVVKDVIYAEEQDNQFAIDAYDYRPGYHIAQTHDEGPQGSLKHDSQAEKNAQHDADPKNDLNDCRCNHFAECQEIFHGFSLSLNEEKTIFLRL